MASSPFPRPLSAAVFISSLIPILISGCGSGEPVARIDGEAVGPKEFGRQLRILKSLRPDTNLDEATRRQVLEQLVRQKLLTLEAKRLGLDKDNAVAEAMRRQREQVRAELTESIKNAQAQLEQLDTAVEQKVLIERLLQSRQSSVAVSEAEIKEAYAQRLKQAAPGSKVQPLKEWRAQLSQQIVLEKLVQEAKPRHRIELYPDASQGSID